MFITANIEFIRAPIGDELTTLDPAKITNDKQIIDTLEVKINQLNSVEIIKDPLVFNYPIYKILLIGVPEDFLLAVKHDKVNWVNTKIYLDKDKRVEDLVLDLWFDIEGFKIHASGSAGGSIELFCITKTISAFLKDMTYSAVANTGSKKDINSWATSANYLGRVIQELSVNYPVKNGYRPILGLSNFSYKKIKPQQLNVIELFQYIHDKYPPNLVATPFIFDDSYNEIAIKKDELGQVRYNELSFLNMDNYPSIDLNESFGIKEAGNLIVRDDMEYFKDFDEESFESSGFVLNIPDSNFPTVVHPNRNNPLHVQVPKLGTNVVTLETKELPSRNNYQELEVNYDHAEFILRRQTLLDWIKTEPRIQTYKILFSDPRLINFGTKYNPSLSTEAKAFDSVPIRIRHLLKRDREEKFICETDVAFYTTFGENVIK